MRARLVALTAALALLVSAPAPAETLYLRDGTDSEHLDPILAKLKDTKEATLVITSPGGSVLDGMMFILEVERLRSEGLVVHCVGDFIVLSMAAVILESGACSDRAVTDRTIVLFHGIQAPPSPMADALNHALAVIISHRLGVTVEEYTRHIAGGDWLLTAEEALAARVVDRVIRPQP